jgi:hypothetical protein
MDVVNRKVVLPCPWQSLSACHPSRQIESKENDMVYRGRVENGVVVLEVPGALRDGTEVTVEPVPRRRKKAKPAKRPTVSQALKRLAGKAKGLPPDAARNIDHYLYGHAKR